MISAVNADDEIHEAVREIIDQPHRDYCASSFVRLETATDPDGKAGHAQAAFYDIYFEEIVAVWANDLDAIVKRAEDLRREDGRLAAMDAIHLAAAEELDAEFITGEKPSKPLFNVDAKVSVTSIRDS